MKALTKFYLMWKDRKGATMAEYAVIAAVRGHSGFHRLGSDHCRKGQ